MDKRITILAGHYGSGKTNIAVNLAFFLKREGKNVSVCDLDIVNPYFRTKDSLEDFEKAGIRLISSEFANTNVDVPALPQAMYAVMDDRESHFVLDIGGDDRGALALGRLAPSILEENNYEMLLVVNFFRPLTKDSQSMLEVMREMEQAAGIRFTGIVNNSNLGEETTPDDVISTVEKVQAFSELCGLPVVMTSVREELYETLRGKINDLFPLKLQKKYY
ncbi:MAG: hypothetical protein E7580_03275 [Ruminococcaceae bacterium]|nr:hypothetical protein [Oscillospiraceae bacterium]